MTARRDFLGAVSAVGASTFLGGIGTAAPDAGDPGPDPAGAELRARNTIVAIDGDTRRHYDTLRAELIPRLGPVVVVENDSRGGLFTLVHEGRRESLWPVSDIFELAKSIAHVPLGIFSILAPYLSRRIPNPPGTARLDRHDVDMVAFEGPGTTEWIGPLRAFGATLADARRHLGDARLPGRLDAASGHILDAALEFIARSAGRAAFDTRSFEDFTGGLGEAIATNIEYAARAQIGGVTALMNRWRDEVGPGSWPGLYVVVLSIWTTSAPNQNSIIVKRFMDPATADSHLIDIATAQPPTDPVLVALDNLARIVQDNVAAELVFPHDRRSADALKGREDLLAREIQDQLGSGRSDPGRRRCGGSRVAFLEEEGAEE
ncbi:hypothetical protein [Embleya scabrispora]|uniref:hypothetical protein n=1 Tax=Embleya scabrispora TaxID=159449 RepID=UPI001914447C|nr:hypothetical protein [Embleya scabrispora]